MYYLAVFPESHVNEYMSEFSENIWNISQKILETGSNSYKKFLGNFGCPKWFPFESFNCLHSKAKQNPKFASATIIPSLNLVFI